MRQHGVPHWFGEFGCIYTDSALEPSRLRVMKVTGTIPEFC